MSNSLVGRGLLILSLLSLAAMPAGSAYAQAANLAAAPANLPVAAQAPADVVGNGSPGSCSDSMLDAALADGGSITFNCGAAPITITVALKTLTRTVSLDGGGLVTLSGAFSNQIFSVPPTVTLTLNNISLIQGYTADPGGAIQNKGKLLVTNSQLHDNQSFSVGGAIYNSGVLTLTNTSLRSNSGTNGGGVDNAGTATLTGGTFDANSANNSGGGFENDHGTASLLNVNLTGNLAGNSGGGLDNAFGTLTLTGVNLTGNATTNVGSGGGLSNYSGRATLTRVNLSLNSAQYFGGGIANRQITTTATLVISGTTLANNLATDFVASGGGLYNDQGTVIVTDTTFVSNTTTGGASSGIGGGGLFNSLGSVSLTTANFMSNTASYDGGGLVNHGGAMTVTRSSFSGNSAWFGGGIENQSTGALLSVVDTSLRANHAYTTYFGGTGNGGGLDNFGGAATLTNDTLSGNFSVQGGGIENDAAALQVSNSTLSGNSASYGGGLDNYYGPASLSYVTLSGNSAASGGGLRQRGATASEAITLTDTIVAHGATGVDCLVAGGAISITSNNDNLSDDTSCNPYLTKSGDQKNVNPLLGPLADNGGPTLTQLPAAGSPAVDHGGLVCPATDQRGVTRPQGPACDVGSVERQGTTFVPSHYLYLPVLSK